MRKFVKPSYARLLLVEFVNPLHLRSSLSVLLWWIGLHCPFVATILLYVQRLEQVRYHHLLAALLPNDAALYLQEPSQERKFHTSHRIVSLRWFHRRLLLSQLNVRLVKVHHMFAIEFHLPMQKVYHQNSKSQTWIQHNSPYSSLQPLSHSKTQRSILHTLTLCLPSSFSFNLLFHHLPKRPLAIHGSRVQPFRRRCNPLYSLVFNFR